MNEQEVGGSQPHGSFIFLLLRRRTAKNMAHPLGHAIFLVEATGLECASIAPNPFILKGFRILSHYCPATPAYVPHISFSAIRQKNRILPKGPFQLFIFQECRSTPVLKYAASTYQRRRNAPAYILITKRV